MWGYEGSFVSSVPAATSVRQGISPDFRPSGRCLEELEIWDSRGSFGRVDEAELFGCRNFN